jgi:hypothetical protein
MATIGGSVAFRYAVLYRWYSWFEQSPMPDDIRMVSLGRDDPLDRPRLADPPQGQLGNTDDRDCGSGEDEHAPGEGGDDEQDREVPKAPRRIESETSDEQDVVLQPLRLRPVDDVHRDEKTDE